MRPESHKHFCHTEKGQQTLFSTCSNLDLDSSLMLWIVSSENALYEFFQKQTDKPMTCKTSYIRTNGHMSLNQQQILEESQ